MWNEKEFFEDYIKQTEKIEPEQKFVDGLKELAHEEEKKTVISWRKYAVLAASFLVCIGIGAFAWRISGASFREEHFSNQPQIQAGKGEGQTESGTIKEIDAAEKLKEAAAYVQNTEEVIITSAGKELTKDQREELKEWLDLAEPLKEGAGTAGDAVSYLCEGKEQIEICVYDGRYITLSTTETVYEIQ